MLSRSAPISVSLTWRVSRSQGTGRSNTACDQKWYRDGHTKRVQEEVKRMREGGQGAQSWRHGEAGWQQVSPISPVSPIAAGGRGDRNPDWSYEEVTMLHELVETEGVGNWGNKALRLAMAFNTGRTSNAVKSKWNGPTRASWAGSSDADNDTDDLSIPPPQEGAPEAEQEQYWSGVAERRLAAGQHSSPFVGVSWDKSLRRWQVEVCYEGTPHVVGHFLDETEAADLVERFAAQEADEPGQEEKEKDADAEYLAEVNGEEGEEEEGAQGTIEWNFEDENDIDLEPLPETAKKDGGALSPVTSRGAVQGPGSLPPGAWTLLPAAWSGAPVRSIPSRHFVRQVRDLTLPSVASGAWSGRPVATLWRWGRRRAAREWQRAAAAAATTAAAAATGQGGGSRLGAATRRRHADCPRAS